jgi:hypothetical protein
VRAGRDIEGDLIGAGVCAAVVVLMPVAAIGASWPPVLVGLLAGLAIGLPLSRVAR